MSRSRYTFAAALAAVLAASLMLAACQSTQDKARKLQAEGSANLQAQKPLTISRPNKDLKIVGTTVLHDQYGDAVVISVHNPTRQALVDVPILIDVRGADGKTVSKNDTYGIDYSLNHITAIGPGETLDWVNDQLGASATPKSVKATLGDPEAPAPKGGLPEIDLTSPQVKSGTQGIQGNGSAKNGSKIDQLKVPVYIVARQGSRIVAAGRGVIKNLKVGRASDYNPFFVGDPEGAQVSAAATATTFE